MRLGEAVRYGETNVDFPRRWRPAALVSLVLVAVSLISLGTLGVNRGIEFSGGTSWEVHAPGTSVGEARDFLRPLGLADATIQVVDGTTLRIRSTVDDPRRAQEIAGDLAELGEVAGMQSVGPSWGREVTEKSVRAVVVFFVLVAAFLSWRLEWKMAVGALVAVVHDVLIAVGVYSLLQILVTPATVVAFLTIMGYSLYDTVVVFDKVKEVGSRPTVVNRLTYTDAMRSALNQVLMRSVNTTLTALLPVVVLLIVGQIRGAETLREFAVALLVGLLVGAYSSLFVAAPIVAFLKEREPRHREVRERLAHRGAPREPTPAPPEPALAASTVGTAAGDPPRASSGSGRPPPGAIPPRPRKKKRR